MRSSCNTSSFVLLTLTLLACAGDNLEPGDETPAGSGGQSPVTGGSGGSAGQPEAGQGGAGLGGMAGAGAGGEAGISGSSGQAGAAGSPSGTPCNEPGTFACINNTLLLCSPGTKILAVVETCSDDGHCDEASGKCLQCKPGMIVGCLDDKNQSMCDPDGTPSKVVPCPEETPFCNKGKCVICNEDSDCPALDPKDDCNVPACSQNACVGKPLPFGSKPASQEACTLRLCDGNGGSTVTPLEAGVACEGEGVCNGKGGCGECIPGARECTDGSSFRVCDENGKWQKSELCTDKPACDAGTCQGIVQMQSSGKLSCALLENKRVRCWGELINEVPVREFATEFQDIVQIAVHDSYLCGLDSSGDVRCSGFNLGGQFGIGWKGGINNPQKEPQKVNTSLKFSYISAGKDFVCAVAKQDQELYCWGNNQLGQLGFVPQKDADNAAFSPRKVGILVSDEPKEIRLATGDAHACVITDKLRCWGDNTASKLSSSAPSIAPITVIEPTGAFTPFAKSVALSSANTLLVKVGIGSKLEEINHTFESRGLDPMFSGVGPQNVLSEANAADVRMIATSPQARIVITLGGNMIIQGDSLSGILGNGKQVVGKGTKIHTDAIRDGVSLSGTHACAWKKGGMGWCWGQNQKGQAIPGGDAVVLTPTPIRWGAEYLPQLPTSC